MAEIVARPFQTGEAFSFPASPFDLFVDGKLTRKYYAYAGQPVWGETPDGPRVLGIYQTASDETEKENLAAQLNQIRNCTDLKDQQGESATRTSCRTL